MAKRRNEKNEARGLLEGEGSYSATRNYNRKLVRALADEPSIKRGAERARRAVEGPEGPALRAAEQQARRGPKIRTAAHAQRGPNVRKRARARRARAR